MWSSTKTTHAIERRVEVVGQIELAAKDFDDSVLAVNLRDAKGQPYLIDDTPMGEKLLRIIGENVCVRGFLRRDDGVNVLRVDTFSIVNRIVKV